jgi:hypothetical protein
MSSRRVGRPAAALSEQQIRKAMSLSTSNRGASRILNVTLETYRLYAQLYKDPVTGRTLYDIHKNQSGKGVKKFFYSSKETPLTDLLQQGVNVTSYKLEKLKHRLIYEGLLKNECCKCQFNEHRVTDLKVPLLLNYKDGNKTNWTLSNLELVCYNCYFLYVGDVFDDQQLRMIEDFGAPVVQNKEPDWDLDDYFKQHFENLGLINDDSKSTDDGSEFIAKL